MKEEITIKKADGTIVKPLRINSQAKNLWTPEKQKKRKERNEKREMLYHICKNCDHRDWDKLKMPHHAHAWKYKAVAKKCPVCKAKDSFEPQDALVKYD